MWVTERERAGAEPQMIAAGEPEREREREREGPSLPVCVCVWSDVVRKRVLELKRGQNIK